MPETLHVGLLAGESSGDILGAALMRVLRDSRPNVVFSGIGGPLMIAEGLDSMVPMERLSVMGLVDPLKRLPELLSIRRQIVRQSLASRPDVFIGIDYPEFNLSVEKRLRRAGIKTVHYVSPSVWAWRQGRIKKIKQAVDLMLTLFPFEDRFYLEHGVPVSYVGHPLADEIPLDNDMVAARQALGLSGAGRVLALLPGSRLGEISRLAPVFLQTAERCQAQWGPLQCVIPCASEAGLGMVESLVRQYAPALDCKVIPGRSRQAMAAADAVLLASGTASLEAMLLKKPMVVAYRMAPLSYAIISRLVKAPFISLPNLLAGKALVTELLQDAVTADNLFAELDALFRDPERQASLRREYTAIHHNLRQGASQRAAAVVLDLCRQ